MSMLRRWHRPTISVTSIFASINLRRSHIEIGNRHPGVDTVDATQRFNSALQGARLRHLGRSLPTVVREYSRYPPELVRR